MLLSPPLTIVTVLLRELPAIGDISYVAELLSAFLERRGELSLAQTCAYSSLVLLDRMWNTSPTANGTDTGTDTGHWSIRQFLRSDRHYCRHQFIKSLVQAARWGDLRMAQWLFIHFSGCLAEVEVVQAAADGGHLHVLKFLWASGRPLLTAAERGSFMVLEESADHEDAEIHREHSVEWGRNDVVRAAQKGHREVVWWLLRTVGDAERELDEITSFAVTYGEIPQVQWMLKHGLPEKGEIEPVAGRVDALQWLFDHGHRTSVSKAMALAAEHGHLELVQWLARQKHKIRATTAVEAACKQGHSTIALYLLTHRLGRSAERALQKAAGNNHLELANILLAHGFRGDMSDAMFAAAENGHLDAVKWLYEHFADKPEATLFPGPSRYMMPHGGSAENAMDVAAKNGHLEVLQFLHAVDDGNTAERVRMRGNGDWQAISSWGPICTRRAMDCAALNGHLDVVKWLHHNRPDVRSREALICSIISGRVDVVEWLLAHDSNDFPDQAMNYAALYGHLPVLKVLDSRGVDGCTVEAMNGAARYGHLEVVQWLHEHRREGCTEEAIESAAEQGHFEVVLFLHSQRWEDCHRIRTGGAVRMPQAYFMIEELRSRLGEMLKVRRQFGWSNPDIMRWMQEHEYRHRE